MLDNISATAFPKVENNNNNHNNWSCYYYPEALPLPNPMSFDSEHKWSSCSSSSCEDSDYQVRSIRTTPKTKLKKIKKKLKARDRDNEIDYLLKRKSLKLCRQSSNGSTVSSDPDPFSTFSSDPSANALTLPGQRPKRVLSRQSSWSSMSESFKTCLSGGSGLDQPGPSSASAMSLPSIQYRVVGQLAKHLRSNCDKILDMSVPFVVDSCVLWSVSEAVNELMSNNPMPEAEDTENGGRSEYVHQVMFLADVFEQTPSLCISLSDMNSIPGDMDLTLFRNLQVLELRKVPPHMVSGLNTIRINLKKLKCTRCLDSLHEIFSASTSAELLPPSSTSPSGTLFPTNSLTMTLTSVWPELREIDVSFNRIEVVDMKALELTPSVEILNLSRNRISAIDHGFSRVLSCLSVLNLNYNQLTSIPPVPPSLKVLLLSNNYISTLNCPVVVENLKNLEMLDISQNMISDETQLESLRHLTSLKSLVCNGNPVSYLDKYRSKLCANLSRLVLTSKTFLLDKKKLSNSEVRSALEKIKSFRPAPLIIHQMVSSSFDPFPFPSTPGGCGSAGNRDRLCDLKSLTQSFDSNSSSVRSACRKKAKIREIVVLDTDDVDGFSSSVDSENRDPKSRHHRKGSDGSGSGLSTSDTLSLSEKSEIMVLETKNAIASLRDKYGNDNWLLRQAGCEVGKLLGIPDKVTKLAALSKSLPVSRDSTFYSTVTGASWEETRASASGQSGASLDGREPLSETSGSNSTVGQSHDQDTSDESIKQVTDLSNSSEGIGVVYESCETHFEDDSINTVAGEGEPGSSSGIFASNTGAESDVDFFSRDYHKATHFRFFQSGQALQLSILDHFLFEVDPEQQDVILSKWDLKSLKSITEETTNSDTDTVTFQLSFDTLRKQLRERKFVMSSKDFKIFNEMASPFLQVRTLQEFADGFQCVKCNAQFSKGMANIKIVESQTGVPTEVHVCPNSECQSDLLIPLDQIPLPNNESFNLSDADLPAWGQPGQTPLRCSTPLSGLFRPNSLPKSGFFGSLETGNTPHNLESNPNPTVVVTPSNINTPPSYFGSKGKSRPDVTANNNTEENPAGQNPAAKNTKSDSDIEVLSCDSSSIEVLTQKGDGDSGSSSDIEVEEAVEISVPDFAIHGKPLVTVPMTESNSSGSYAESVCTAYERTPCSALSISQQLSPPLNSSTSSLVSSTCISSTSAACSPNHSVTTTSTNPTPTVMPIRYDYENFAKVDHRLQLFCEISIFKSPDEKLLALTKVMVVTSTGAFLSVVIFTNKKIYLYKITAVESDKPEDWLQKVSCFPNGKLLRLDVLIGRQGVGLDFAGKPHALIFRDSGRTSKFIEFFLCDICGEFESPPLVQDFSNAQKSLMSPVDPISYFGVLRFALCETADKAYSVSALVLTDKEIILVADLTWMVNRSVESVSRKHTRSLSTLRQVECLEIDATFVKLVFELTAHVFWDIYFETQEERDIFIKSLNCLAKDIPFISLSQPLEP